MITDTSRLSFAQLAEVLAILEKKEKKISEKYSPQEIFQKSRINARWRELHAKKSAVVRKIDGRTNGAFSVLYDHLADISPRKPGMTFSAWEGSKKNWRQNLVEARIRMQGISSLREDVREYSLRWYHSRKDEYQKVTGETFSEPTQRELSRLRLEFSSKLAHQYVLEGFSERFFRKMG